MATEAKLIHEIAPLRAELAQWRREGQRIALVPTMGCLHAGHLALVDEAAQRAEKVVVSIFVNPLQFSAGEDLDRYPRTLQSDCEALAGRACDLIFAPSEATLYPRGRDQLTEVQVPGLSGQFCGVFRPGHFAGVTTVVNLLLNLVQPDSAIFGEKDWQQLFLIRRMVSDLHMAVEIVGVPTLREADGLAMSSRNVYLSAEQRQQAARLSAVMRELVAEIQAQPAGWEQKIEHASRLLQSAGMQTQYLQLVDAGFSPPDGDLHGELRLLAAVQLGAARLIDNMPIQIVNP